MPCCDHCAQCQVEANVGRLQRERERKELVRKYGECYDCLCCMLGTGACGLSLWMVYAAVVMDIGFCLLSSCAFCCWACYCCDKADCHIQF